MRKQSLFCFSLSCVKFSAYALIRWLSVVTKSILFSQAFNLHLRFEFLWWKTADFIFFLHALLFDASVNCSVKSLLAFLLQFLSDSDCKTLSLYFLKFVTPSSFKLFLFSVVIKLMFYCLSFCFRIINNFSKRINAWSSVTVVCSDKANSENIVK